MRYYFHLLFLDGKFSSFKTCENTVRSLRYFLYTYKASTWVTSLAPIGRHLLILRKYCKNILVLIFYTLIIQFHGLIR